MSWPTNGTPVTLCSLKDRCDFVSGCGVISSVVHLSEVTVETLFDLNGVKTWTPYTCFSLLFKGDP